MPEIPVTLWLSEADAEAVRYCARRYGRTEEQQVAEWIAAPLADAVRMWESAQWDARKRTLEASPELAATVDAARVRTRAV